MLRHTFVTTMLDAGVDLRDVQIAARHADPRTTMRYDRARQNLDRHPNYILAAFMASGTRPKPAPPAGSPREAHCTAELSMSNSDAWLRLRETAGRCCVHRSAHQSLWPAS
jgi:hypothetical protein